MLKNISRILVSAFLILSLTTSITVASAPQPPKLYFGQPVSAFSSKTVAYILPIIQKQFPEWYIENPNQKKHQKSYQLWKKKTGVGMDYYFMELLPTMSGGIFLPFPDGSWSAGAYGEALRLEELGQPIWKITFDGTIEKTTTKDMRLWGGGVLSVPQTREKNKTPYDALVKLQ